MEAASAACDHEVWVETLGVYDNRGPEYSTLNRRIPIELGFQNKVPLISETPTWLSADHGGQNLKEAGCGEAGGEVPKDSKTLE